MPSKLDAHRGAVERALAAGDSYRSIARALDVNKDTVANFVRHEFPDFVRQPAASAESLDILMIDIETKPNLAHVWRLWDENVGLDQLVEPVEVLSWAAKWYGLPYTIFKSSYHNGKDEMVRTAWKLLDTADVVMHYNGRRFDVPHLNREFLELGLTPPSPFKQIDLLRMVKRQFSFPSYKLAYVSQALGLEGKVEHEGFKLWLRCMDGDEAAWKRMRDYNIRDVLLLEDLYEKLLPWLLDHPSYGAFAGEDLCPNCGSDQLSQEGTVQTKLSSFPKYRCANCGKWSRGTKREGGTKIVEVTP